MTAWSVLAFVPAFGIDTLVVAAGLGASAGGSEAVGRRRRVAVTFAVFEGAMPIAGAALGALAGALAGRAALWAAAALLVALGLREAREGWAELREARQGRMAPGETRRGRANGQEEGDGPGHRTGGPTGWALLAGGLSVSMDELGAGLAAGAAGVPLRVLAPVLALQAALLTWAGLALGSRLRRLTGRYGELAAGLALVAVGLAVAAGWI